MSPVDEDAQYSRARTSIEEYLGTDGPSFWSQESQVRKRLDVSSIPGKIDHRVFIGGNYVLMPVLRFIEGIVLREDLQPVLAADFDMPRERTSEYSHRLLMQCRRAIFEVTLANGHLMEIQSVIQSGHLRIGMLLAYMAYDEEKDWPDTISAMIKSIADPRPQGYATLQELDRIVSVFLKTPTP